MAASRSGTRPCVFSDASLQQLSTWDPASEAFQNETFNSYINPESTVDVLESFRSKKEASEKDQTVLPSEVNEKSVTLFVGNIPLSISQDGLLNFFSRAAPVKSARILTSRNPQKRTTYGFVRVSSIEDAGKIIRKFNHYSFGTKYNLFIKLTESDEERARKRERIKEDEEFYERIYQEYKANLEKSGEGLSESTSPIDNESVKEKTTQVMETETKKKAKTCIGCSKEGLKVCSRCKACYCSVECQKSHWPVHQKECGKSRDVKSNKKPITNGIVNHEQRKPLQNAVEDEFLVEMDGYNTDSDVAFRIEDMKPQTQLKICFKAVVYVIEDMLMKGQAVDATETERFLELMEELSQYFTNAHQPLSPDICKEGILVLFNYLGEVTRGVVTEFDSSKGEATVLAIDYGNNETVKVSDLFLMPSFALRFPMQCRTLALHGLPASIDASTKFSLNEHLKSITQERIFDCNVKGETNGVYNVVMTIEDKTESVNDMIRSQYERLKELKEVKMPKCIMLQYIPLQPYPTEPEFDVIITEVRSPSCFFAQILTKDSSNIIALSQLFNQLQELKTDTDLVDFHPVANEACLAFFIQDQTWARAAVERINHDGTVRVSFIDYGNVEDIDTCYIRPMRKEFSLLPRQARKFCIAGVQSASANGEWSDEASRLFKELFLSESICHASCVSIDGDICSIKLYLPSLNCYPHELLLDKGHAIAVGSCKQKDISELVPYTLQSPNLRRTGDYRVIPVHFESPHEFYVQVANAEKVQKVFEFDALIQRLPVVRYDKPVPEDSCCALFSDDVWYRAKVLSVKGTECSLYFYDYGNKATLPIEKLREMPEEMKSLEAQAIRTKLDNVDPVGESWTDKAKELMDNSLSFQPCVLNVSKIENELVIGKLTVEESGIDVARLLIEAHLAKPQSSMNNIGSQGGAEGIKEDSSFDLDQSTRPVTQVNAARNAFTLSAEKLASTSTQRVIPVHFESPHEFYVQIANSEKIQQVFEFDALLQSLPVIQYDNPIPEDSCCALFSDDMWYRAKVISVLETECCVYFYDYGNKATLPIEKLREMPEEMKSLEAQAIRTKLDNVDPVGESWTDKAKELMDNSLFFQPCVLNISNVENCTVSGSLLREGDGLDISKQLVVSCLARSVNHSSRRDDTCIRGRPTTDASDQKENSAGEEQSEGAFHCKPASKEVKRNGVTDISNHASDSEKSSGDSVSGEHNFHSQKSKKFSYRQNSKDRNRNFAASRNEPVSRTQDHEVADNGSKMRRNYQIPPFPSYSPFMFPSMLFGSDFPYPAMPGYKGESDEGSDTSESHVSRGPSRGGRGSSLSWRRGTASGQGNILSRGRGHALNDWVDAFNQMSSFMYSSRGRHAYGAFRHQDSFRGWRGGRGRGGFHSTSRGPKSSHEKFYGYDSGKITPSLRIGSEVECVVTCIEHPFHFYIKLSKDIDCTVFSDEIYENAAFARNVEFGMLGAAKASVTGGFFRAKVERVYSEERVLVRDVDSGITEIIDLPSGLKQLHPNDASKPYQAIRCALNNIVPKNRDRWSVTATKYLKHRLVVRGKKVKARVCGESSFAVSISIHDPDSKEASVEEDLVKMGFARVKRL